jgi:alpha-L-fucosidase
MSDFIVPESLSARPVPPWWREARFGIFVHWGPYSVPAYADDDYSEWYWKHVQSKPATRAFHDRTYGPDFTYPDFFPHFRAELFDPAEWAELFRRSGAKYVVLTAKHNDGFCLWPNATASAVRGRPWHAGDAGPRRDVVAELTEAVEKSGLRMGLYFLLYEWDNPIYLADPARFIDEVSIPQMKELVEKYDPWLLWTDGGWQHSAADYRSVEVLEWMVTRSRRGADFVFNDRWGHPLESTIGHRTTEYTYAIDCHNYTQPWEETRGMGTSFAYNRREKLEDYATAEELILTLVDVVSHGGNLLLDIGPRADGQIPLLMQERLLQIGSWLEVHGEAIHGSTPWTRPCQWSAGKNPLEGFGKKMEAITDGIAQRLAVLEQFDILKLTLHPEPGHARKEWMFTRGPRHLFAFCPGFPPDKAVIRDLVLDAGAEITVLGWGGRIPWRQAGEQVELDIPRELARDNRANPLLVFRIPLPMTR